MNKRIALLIVIISYLTIPAKPFRANLILPSTGSWMTFSGKPRPSMYNKFAVTTYCQVFGLSGMFKIPVTWAIPSTKPKTQRVMFSDFDFYLGKRFGWIVPRLGLEFPLGYALMDNWKRRGWIGANNLRLQGGFSISRTEFERVGLPFGVDAMMSVSLTEKNARYERGAIGGQLYVKTSKDLSKKINVGAELAVYGKTGVPTWWPFKRESGITILPATFGSYRLNRKLYVGIKGGFGPSFSYTTGRFIHKSNSCDVGMSFQYYP
jgi:hypothetical protein